MTINQLIKGLKQCRFKDRSEVFIEVGGQKLPFQYAVHMDVFSKTNKDFIICTTPPPEVGSDLKKRNR